MGNYQVEAHFSFEFNVYGIFMELQMFHANICMQLVHHAWKSYFNMAWLDKADSNNHTVK